MRMWRERTNEAGISFCDRCGEVCDDACRLAALRHTALLQQLWLGARG